MNTVEQKLSHTLGTYRSGQSQRVAAARPRRCSGPYGVAWRCWRQRRQEQQPEMQ